MSGFLGWDEPQKVVNRSSADEPKCLDRFPAARPRRLHAPGKSFGRPFAGHFPTTVTTLGTTAMPGLPTLAGEWTRRRGLPRPDRRVRRPPIPRVPCLKGWADRSVEPAVRQLAHQPNMTSTSRAELTHDFSARSNASLCYGFGASRSLSATGSRHGTQSVSGRYNHSSRRTRLPPRLRIRRHRDLRRRRTSARRSPIDTGIDYGRSLSLTRSTEFAFSVGTAATTTSHTAEGQTSFSSAHFTGVGMSC